MISILALPFIACIFLVCIHVYFGSFVLKRRILFIDLALAQWAALGYLVGHWLGYEKPLQLFILGFTFTIFAALILTVLKPIFDKNNLQEAVIGVMYIISSTVAMTIISSTGLEGVHLKEMLAGHLLFIQGSELVFTSILYLTIGVILYKIHPYFLKSNSKKWDFIFYLIFGCVVTSSVKMVGILLVFSFLIIPVLSVSIFSSKIKKQIYYGILIGITSSLLGLWLSVQVDIPPSYCVILALCASWVGSLFFFIFKSKRQASLA